LNNRGALEAKKIIAVRFDCNSWNSGVADYIVILLILGILFTLPLALKILILISTSAFKIECFTPLPFAHPSSQHTFRFTFKVFGIILKPNDM